MNRKEYEKLIKESIILLEQDPIDPSAPPPAAAPATLGPQPDPNTGMTQPTQPENEPLTVDKMINRLNVIRGGKSFTDPAVYKMLSDFYGKMQENEKAILDKTLEGIGKVVIDAAQGNEQQQPPAPQQMQQPPPPPAAAPPAPAPAAPITAT